MDWYPLWNSLRIAAISCTIVFFLGIFAAYYGAKLPRAVKGVLDVVFTLPMVLPPTGLRLFSAGAAGAPAAPGKISGAVRHSVCHDLVWRHRGLGGGGLSADVPDSQRGFREL